MNNEPSADTTYADFSAPAQGPQPLPPAGPQPLPQPARPAFRLHRSRNDKMLGGVCGGLAESTGVDATLIRIAMVALTLLRAGSLAIVYIAIWALAPEE